MQGTPAGVRICGPGDRAAPRHRDRGPGRSGSPRPREVGGQRKGVWYGVIEVTEERLTVAFDFRNRFRMGLSLDEGMPKVVSAEL